MADTHLTKTFASAGNRKTFTFSVWLKQAFGLTSGNSVIFSAGSASNTYCQIRMKNANNYIQFEDEQGGSVTATPYTDAWFRDPTAWNHLVVRVDSTQSTAADRIRMYMNGTQLTMSGGSQPGQNQDFVINNNTGHALGTLWRGSDSGGHWNGNMAQAIFCDGQSLAPTSFGSTNSDGVWIPNANPSVTYGTNGFKINFQGTGASADASGFGADSSGNNNHFATTNIGTNPSSKDSPTNNFATLNSIQKTNGQDLSIANLKSTADSSKWFGSYGTIAVSSGKWFWETKSDSTNMYNGIQLIAGDPVDYAASNPQSFTGAICYIHDGQKRIDGSDSSYGASYTTEVIGVALDMDNNQITFYKSGVSQGVINLSGSSYGLGRAVPLISKYNGNVEVNFGNPIFTISSGNADANGYGNFEYAVPSGYYALCTKNLAQYG